MIEVLSMVQNDADYAAKEKAVNSAAASDTKAENDQYAQNVQKQQAANTAAEQAQAQANAKALADAAKNTYTPAQKQSMKDNAAAKKQADMNSAQTVKDQAQQAAKDALSKAQANAQTAHDQAVANQKATNQSRLTEAQNAYKEAVKNAPKTGVVTPAEPEAHNDDDTSDGRLYPNTDANNHSGTFIVNINNESDPNTVHNMNQLDMSGKPGWIYYDGNDDNSEGIDIHNLAQNQKEIINQYAVNELNALRNWFVNNISNGKNINISTDFTPISTGNVSTLHVTDATLQRLDEINSQRTQLHRDQNTHTGTNGITHDADGDYWAECLAGSNDNPTTMLQALIEIHNAIEELAYNELNTSEFSGNNINLDIHSGHLAAILANDFDQAGVFFDYTCAIVLEFSPKTVSGPDINTPEISQILAAQSGQGTPDLNAPSVKKAAQHVKDVEAQNAKDLAAVEGESLADAGQDAYKAAMKQADDNYNDAVSKINAAYDAEIKRINALPSSTADLKASLDQKLADLKKADAAKELKDYKAQLDAKLANADPAKAKHEAFVKANAKKLADLQAEDTASLNALKAKLNAELAALHAKLFLSQPTNDQANADNGAQVAKGNGSTLVMSNGQMVALPSAANKAKTSKESNKKLPQTGNQSGVLALLGAMSAMLGLGAISKKREL